MIFSMSLILTNAASSCVCKKLRTAMSAPESGIAVIVYNSRWLKEGKETTKINFSARQNITNRKKGMNKQKKAVLTDRRKTKLALHLLLDECKFSLINFANFLVPICSQKGCIDFRPNWIESVLCRRRQVGQSPFSLSSLQGQLTKLASNWMTPAHFLS